MLKECLSSLMTQTYPNYEIIVIDAGSTDGSPDLIACEFPKVVLIRERRIGVGEAINRGIRQSRGDFIVIEYNSDEIADPEWLSLLYIALNSSSEVGAVGGLRILYRTGIIDDGGCKIYFFGFTRKLGQGLKYETYSKTPYEVDYLGCMLMNKKVVEKIGFMDEEYFLYGEDEDYGLRIRKTGLKLFCVPKAITWHAVSLSVGHQTSKQRYYLRRAQIRTILKNFSVLNILVSLTWLGFATIADALVVIPFFVKIIDKTRLSLVYTHDSIEGLKESIKAIIWNLRNLRQTFISRLET